jgi:hypothetical protein
MLGHASGPAQTGSAGPTAKRGSDWPLMPLGKWEWSVSGLLVGCEISEVRVTGHKGVVFSVIRSCSRSAEEISVSVRLTKDVITFPPGPRKCRRRLFRRHLPCFDTGKGCGAVPEPPVRPLSVEICRVLLLVRFRGGCKSRLMFHSLPLTLKRDDSVKIGTDAEPSLAACGLRRLHIEILGDVRIAKEQRTRRIGYSSESCEPAPSITYEELRTVFFKGRFVEARKRKNSRIPWRRVSTSFE